MEDFGIRKENDNLRINELRLKRQIEELTLENKDLKEQLKLFGVVRQSEQLKEKYTEEFKDWMTENGWYEPVNLTFFNKDGSTRLKEDLCLEYKKYKDSL